MTNIKTTKHVNYLANPWERINDLGIEASELGLAPGEWPQVLMVTLTYQGERRDRMYLLHAAEDGIVSYTHGTNRLLVFND